MVERVTQQLHKKKKKTMFESDYHAITAATTRERWSFTSTARLTVRLSSCRIGRVCKHGRSAYMHQTTKMTNYRVSYTYFIIFFYQPHIDSITNKMSNKISYNCREIFFFFFCIYNKCLVYEFAVNDPLFINTYICIYHQPSWCDSYHSSVSDGQLKRSQCYRGSLVSDTMIKKSSKLDVHTCHRYISIFMANFMLAKS